MVGAKSKRLTIPTIMIILGLTALGLLIYWYKGNNLNLLDKTVAVWMVGLRSDWLTLIMRSFTNLGETVSVIIIDLVITVFGVGKYREQKKDFILLNLNLGIGAIFMETLKTVIHRHRPPLPWLGAATGFSFPSGHAMMNTLFYGFIIFLLIRNSRPGMKRNWLVIGLACLPVLIGISRVYLGVHYASDVLAGWAAGMAWMGIWMMIREGGMRESRSREAT